MKNLFIILFIALAQITVAQTLSFRAAAPKSVVEGEQFMIEYTLNSAEGTALRVPNFEGLTVLYGPAVSISQSQSYSGGQQTSESTATYSYTVMADKVGTINVPPATIKCDKKQLVSNALTIKVIPPDKAQNRNKKDSRGEDASSDINIFTRIQLSKSKVYEHEAILASLKLYTSTGNINIANQTNPTFDGFVVQDIKLDNISLDNMEHIDGRNYRTAVLAQWLIFPQKTGKLTINSAKYVFVVQVPQRINHRGFGASYSYQEMKKNISSPAVTVDVMPLPDNKPDSYTGGVGAFSLTSSINKQSLKANDAITIKAVIKGTGNLKYVKDPQINFPKDFEVYDPKSTLSLKVTSNGMSGSKVVEYTAIPRYAGKFVIPAITFTYFDTTSKSYKTLKTQDYEVNVEKGASSGEGRGSIDFSDKEAVKLLNKDIRYINADNSLTFEKNREPYLGSVGYWLWYIFPFLALATFVFVTRKQAKENANVALMRNKKANKVASKRLKLAQKYLTEQNKTMFYAEVMRAIWGYLSDKLNLPHSVLNRDNIVVNLQKYGANEELTQQFMQILDTCEFAQYAPVQSDDAMDNLYQDTVNAIGKMENSVKK